MAVKVLAKQEPITEIAKEEQVSRKFVYQQQAIAQLALNQAFEKKEPEQEVLYYLPITHSWIFQFILALILICHCSYRGVVELLRDLLLQKLASEIQILLYWLRIDILSLAGPECSERLELMNFIIEELQLREDQALTG